MLALFKTPISSLISHKLVSDRVTGIAGDNPELLMREESLGSGIEGRSICCCCFAKPHGSQAIVGVEALFEDARMILREGLQVLRDGLSCLSLAFLG